MPQGLICIINITVLNFGQEFHVFLPSSFYLYYEQREPRVIVIRVACFAH